jgi:hypothetical protein
MKIQIKKYTFYTNMYEKVMNIMVQGIKITEYSGLKFRIKIPV